MGVKHFILQLVAIKYMIKMVKPHFSLPILSVVVESNHQSSLVMDQSRWLQWNAKRRTLYITDYERTT